MYKRHLLQIAVLVFTVILMGFSAWAVPGLINYQGKLTDPDGVSMNGYYIMEFYLYNTESGGSHLWTEQQNVAVTNSLYNVKLGGKISFPSDLFDNENLYLEVKVFSTSTAWETLSPRQRLTSTPFAMKAGYASTAGDADTLDGLHASDLFNTGDDYGRSGVAANLYEGTTTLTNKYVNEAQAGSITNGMIVNNAVTSNKIADGAVGTSDLSGNAVTSAKIQDGTIQQSDLSFSVPDGHSLDAADGSPVDAVYVDNSGNVGIGTTSPTEALDVNRNVKAKSFIGDGSGLLGVVKTESDPVFTSWDKSSGISITESQIIDLDHFTNSDETDPVFGTSAASGITSSDINNWDTAYSWGDHSAAGYDTTNDSWTGTGDVYTTSGNVGIGTMSPDDKLHVSHYINSFVRVETNNEDIYSSGIIIGNPSAYGWLIYKKPDGGYHKLYFDYQSSNRLTINAGGNLGIGTTSPSYKLHVNGTAYATGAAGALSDLRHKTNISDLSLDALTIVNELHPVSFEWKEPQDSGMEGTQLGFIAQEVEEVLPEAVLTQDNEEQTKGLKYNALIPLLTKAIQELEAQNKVLKAENNGLRHEIERIKEAIGL